MSKEPIEYGMKKHVEWMTHEDYGPYLNSISVEGKEVTVGWGYDGDESATYICSEEPKQFLHPHPEWEPHGKVVFGSGDDDHIKYLTDVLGVEVKLP
jgi:hypothetical protein